MAKSLRPARIKLEKSIQLEIEQHAYSDLAFELGGMLFGKAGSKLTEIVGFVPALKAEKEQVSLTFTHEVWDEILTEGEQKYPGSSIVGWYHTHPSFGVFLSDYDGFIQQNFFSGKGQLALVIDPIAGSMGWFDLDQRGEIRRIAIEETLSGASPRPAAQQSAKLAATKKRGILATIGLPIASAVVGGLIGFGVASASAPADLSDALTTRDEIIASINSTLSSTQQRVLELEQLQQNLFLSAGYVYSVASESTLSDLVDGIYVDPGALEAVVAMNPGFTGETVLNPGDRILLPTKPWFEGVTLQTSPEALSEPLTIEEPDPVPSPSSSETSSKEP